MQLRSLVGAALLAGLLPAGGQAQSTPTTPALLQSTETPVSSSLQPGDLVRIAIWREEDLSGEFQVDQGGSVILPLLGEKQVVGISPDSLRDELTEAYAKYLVNTAVNVTLLRRINVLGEVRVPGQYTVDATVSIADLIARAQGLTPDGNAEDIRLLREGRTFRTNLSGTESLTAAGIRSGDQIVVGKRGWAARNLASIVGTLSIIANLFVIVSR